MTPETPANAAPASDLDALRVEVASLRAEQRRSARRARVSSGVAALALGATLLLNVRPAALAITPGFSLVSLVSQISGLTSRVGALEQKTAPLSVTTDTTRADGKTDTELYVTGVNVHIVDGNSYHLTDDGTNPDSDGSYVSGATLSGLGNLIIGYNATGNPNGDVRTGSHNLILGDANSYSSYGGIVGGDGNTISGPYASVTGGYSNTASDQFTSVTGGQSNTASGSYASVTGGQSNSASGSYASVTGGQSNSASGADSSVTGGNSNTASYYCTSVSGGQSLTESTKYGWAAGSLSSNGTVSGNFVSP